MHFYHVVQIAYFSFLFIVHTFLLIISPCSCTLHGAILYKFLVLQDTHKWS